MISLEAPRGRKPESTFSGADGLPSRCPVDGGSLESALLGGRCPAGSLQGAVEECSAKRNTLTTAEESNVL